MHDKLNDLVGVPFLHGGRDPKIGLDCWGCTRIAYELLNGKNIPDFSVYSSDNQRLIINKILEEKKFRNKWEEIDSPVRGCMVTFRVGGGKFTNHVGVCVSDTRFIHSLESVTNVAIERLDHPFWKNVITGFFKFIG
uniref:Putative tail protein n=1 Tax=viral metagenome TaxID=1070528 RepID=A0A6M3IKD7_9ZZZZ